MVAFTMDLCYNKCIYKLTLGQKTLHFGGTELMYIPEKRKNRQITLFDFNQSCGMELDPNNEWIKLAHAIPWSRMWHCFLPRQVVLRLRSEWLLVY